MILFLGKGKGTSQVVGKETERGRGIELMVESEQEEDRKEEGSGERGGVQAGDKELVM